MLLSRVSVTCALVTDVFDAGATRRSAAQEPDSVPVADYNFRVLCHRVGQSGECVHLVAGQTQCRRVEQSRYLSE